MTFALILWTGRMNYVQAHELNVEIFLNDYILSQNLLRLFNQKHVQI